MSVPTPTAATRAADAPSSYRPYAQRAVLALAAATVVVRLPFVARSPSPDEGGLLLIAGQWSPGRSLYGAYWVDRPPLLIAFYGLADRLGGVVALRALGLGLVAVAVLLAGLVAHLALGTADRSRLRTVVSAAAVAAVLLCQPRFGTFEIDGELIATPLVLGGLALVLAGARERATGRGTALFAGAGACAAAAALVKQNEIDVVVLLAVASATFLRRAHLSRTRALLAAGGGGATVLAATLALAAHHGTRLPALWEAVVTFRFHASAVIAQSASAATHDRFVQLLLAAALSAVPLLLVRWVRCLPLRPRPGALDLRWASVVVLAWESFSVVGGGSYWQHYLICLVPGLVLAEALRGTVDRPSPALTRPPWALAILTAACLVPLVPAYAAALRHPVGRDEPAAVWLRDRVRPGDTGLVAFGHADILQTTGLTSPYPELWSLPVRVRDPRLVHLTKVLWSRRRPDWVVTGSRGNLSGWELDDRAAEIPFRLLYRQVADLGETRVFKLRGEPRPPR